MISGNTISGRAGCNNFTGQISRTADKISIRKLALTRKMCSYALMAQEQRLIGALESANKLEISKDKPWVWFQSENQTTPQKLVKINDGNVTKPATGTNTLRAVDLNKKQTGREKLRTPCFSLRDSRAYRNGLFRPRNHITDDAQRVCNNATRQKCFRCLVQKRGQ